MPVQKGERFASEDVYIRYDFEDVMFRWDHVAKKIYREFVGTDVEDIVDDANMLYNDALRFGEKITKAEYDSA